MFCAASEVQQALKVTGLVCFWESDGFIEHLEKYLRALADHKSIGSADTEVSWWTRKNGAITEFRL